MKKNKCQAYTKKKIPCKNYAMEGSHFCYVHEGLFKNFPPVEITDLMCPYCDEPLIKDAKFCSFCKEDLTPAILNPDKLDYYRKLINIHNRIAAKAKGMDIRFGCFFIVIFLLFALVVSIISISLYFEIEGL